ncbi:MAG: DUF3368 domain-containing protein [Candidatus Latescibacterota bacterium]|nr:MAG: DUF3368 domain-containing protein [Candidatus Latescibacterota bacterium]RKY74786.1 MAG: DUF3368 domain-containing protein [Candidatus Latescibacterota bacterium]HDH99877.1 DUF3368 domain-containing protein [Bacillota bacterium]
MIVVNATVLSNLASAGKLEILKELFGVVLVPVPVYEEVFRGIEIGYEFLECIEEALKGGDWLKLTSFGEGSREIFRVLLDVVGYGEAAGIAISKERGLTFFSDDKVARKIARENGVKVSGTIGILKVAVEEGKLSIDEANVVLDRMIRGGYRSPVRAIEEVLQCNLRERPWRYR